MSSFHYPVTMTALFGFCFVVLAMAAPWLSWNLGMRDMNSGERLLSAMLGLVLLSLWAMWRWLV